MFNFFRRKVVARKTEAEWAQALQYQPEWQLENIVKNPGEFVVEMRQAAATILSQRESRSRS
jgi:hypothetical protein